MPGGRAQALVVHHHEVFAEHHLPHAPEAVHDFAGGGAGVAPDIMLSPYEGFGVTPKRTRESRVLPRSRRGCARGRLFFARHDRGEWLRQGTGFNHTALHDG